MVMSTKIKHILEIDSYYDKSEIIEMGMTQLNNHKMDYLLFEKNSKVYFFEKINEHSLRLFCVTSRQSFYLS